jgi:hypothetical protein
MTASLTPALALAYLQELSVDVRAAVVLDRAGAPLAGDADLAARARHALAAAAGRSTSAGPLLVARTRDGGAIAVLAGPRTLVSLLEHDLAETAAALVTTSAADL